ncbi:hypothetical protein [Cupriavidus necator]
MTKQKQAKESKRSPNNLRVTQRPDETPEAARASVAVNPVIRGGVTGHKFAGPFFGDDLDLTAYVAELGKQADKVKAGDTSALETMLMTQASTLDMMFNLLAYKAENSEYLNKMESYLRHALRAQAQCRATLETLAEIKNPRPVAFVKQANIAHGHQQVNNGVPPPSRAHGNDNQSNELLGASNGEWLDTGAAGEASRGNQALEAVGAVNRAPDGKRKG